MATAHTPGATDVTDRVMLGARVPPEFRRRMRVACAQRSTTVQEVITGLAEEWLAGEDRKAAGGS
jgi:hypothetical protein